MAKQNWLNKQLDQASTTVRSWSNWKRETIRSQIAQSGGASTSQTNPDRQHSNRETGGDRKLSDPSG
jgi:hypothetical protein